MDKQNQTHQKTHPTKTVKEKKASQTSWRSLHHPDEAAAFFFRDLNPGL